MDRNSTGREPAGGKPRWTLVFPPNPTNFMVDYHRMLRDLVGRRVAYREVNPDNARPVLSKYREIPRFRALAREPGPFHVEQAFLANLAFARLPRCVVTVWDLARVFRPDLAQPELAERVDNVLIRRGARRADHIVTISEDQKRELATRLPYPEERITVAYLGVDPALYHPLPPAEQAKAREALRARYGVAEDEATILGIIGWQPRKNVPGFLRTARVLLDRGRKVRLLMQRNPSRWSGPIEALIRDLRLEPHIAWIPRLDHAQRVDHLRGSDVLLFPTYYEGFGMPPVEAMACGCPVVASDVSTMPEVVGDAGLLAPPDDHAALADAVERVLDDPRLRAELVRRGVAKARRYTWEAAAEAHLRAYEAVAGR